MTRRIDIELTSHADEVWTWRAAGAKLPKGSLADADVPQGAAVGDVLRAEVESGIDGLEIVSLSPKAEKADEKAVERIEVLSTPLRESSVSVSYAPGAKRRRDGSDRPGREGTGRHGVERRPGRAQGPGRGEHAVRGEGPGRGEHAGRGERAGRAEGPGRGERPGRGEGRVRRTGPERAGGEAGGRGEGPRPRDRERERKVPVSTTHRNALLATLGPEQLPVAEQLLRGGIPAVRKAIAEHEGAQTGAPGNAEALLAIAEELLPAVNLASWKDRATAAQSEGSELRLRDLRAVVAASRTVNLDEQGRALAKVLTEMQEHRVAAQRNEWVGRITNAIESGRLIDALHAAQRPPEPATRVPAELAVALAEAVSAAMTAETDPETWLALLEAVVESPVRRTVRPAGIPASPAAMEAARRAAGLVPALAKLLGLRIPPPPPRRTPPARPPLMPTGGGGPAASL
jgi:hypothetical protein